MKNPDMPAMPTEDICLGYDEVECRELTTESRGLTKREHIAAMAMQGLLSNLPPKDYTDADGFIIRSAVLYAEELLKELEK